MPSMCCVIPRTVTLPLLVLGFFLFSPNHTSAAQLLSLDFEGTPSQVTGCPGGRDVQGYIGPGWHDNSCWIEPPQITIRYVHDTVNPHGGTYSQRVELISGRVQLLSAPAALTAGRLYTAKIWMRSQSPTKVSFALHQAISPWTFIAGQEFDVTTDWKQFTINTPSSPLTTQAFLIVDTANPNILWLDDATLEEHIRSPELLSNPGLEGGTDVAISWGSSQEGTGSYVVDFQTLHGGLTSQKISVETGKLAISAGLPLAQGNRYDVSVWMKSDNAADAALTRVTLENRNTGLPYAATTVFVPQTWTQYRFSGFTNTVPGILKIQAQTRGTLWVDDVSVTAVSDMSVAALPTQRIPLQYFGLHIHQHRPSTWPPASLSFGSRRIMDGPAHTTWDEIASCSSVNPDGTCAQPIGYNWAGLDAVVDEAALKGIDLVMNLGRTPRWASARPDELSPYCDPSTCSYGSSAEPKNDQVWRDWVTAVASRYRGRIRFWEIWNEPAYPWNCGNNNERRCFFTGMPADLLSLQQQAYSILKGIDPTNMVITPGFADWDYAEHFMHTGGGWSADILGYHFYIHEGSVLNGTDQAPEKIYNYYAATARHLAENYTPVGKKLAVWNTEQGWLSPAGTCAEMDRQTGAAFLARANILNWASGIERFYFYAWDNQCMAVWTTETDDSTLTPAGTAYQVSTDWLKDQRMSGVFADADGNWIVTLTDPSGQLSYIVWNPTAAKTFTVPAAWQVSQKQKLLDSSPSQVGAGWNITVDYSPVRLWLVSSGTTQPPLSPTRPRGKSGKYK